MLYIRHNSFFLIQYFKDSLKSVRYGPAVPRMIGSFDLFGHLTSEINKQKVLGRTIFDQRTK